VVPAGSYITSNVGSNSIQIDQGLTVSFWVKLNSSTTTNADTFNFGGNGPYIQNFNINIKSNGTTFNLWQNDGSRVYLTPAVTFTTGVWYNIVISINTSKLVTYYINGTSVASGSYTSTGTTVGQEFTLGGPVAITNVETEYSNVIIYSSYYTPPIPTPARFNIDFTSSQVVYQNANWSNGRYPTTSFATITDYYAPVAGTPSPYTWTKPTGGNWIRIECIGGGGGGASVAPSVAAGGGGGGGYNYLILPLSSVTASTVAVSVGAGGTAGSSGGNSTFGPITGAAPGTTVTGYAGAGTPGSTGGTGGGMDSANSGSVGGASITAGIIFGGGGGASGGNSTPGGPSVYGGAGGGGLAAPGTPLRAAGVSVFGGSGGAANPSGTPGTPGSILGGGGAGSSGGTGGSGGSGRVRIITF
jgi:hypothetical protein